MGGIGDVHGVLLDLSLSLSWVGCVVLVLEGKDTDPQYPNGRGEPSFFGGSLRRFQMVLVGRCALRQLGSNIGAVGAFYHCSSIRVVLVHG